MIKAVATTLTAVMITAFMVRDRDFQSQTLVMAGVLWLAAGWLWWYWRLQVVKGLVETVPIGKRTRET